MKTLYDSVKGFFKRSAIPLMLCVAVLLSVFCASFGLTAFAAHSSGGGGVQSYTSWDNAPNEAILLRNSFISSLGFSVNDPVNYAFCPVSWLHEDEDGFYLSLPSGKKCWLEDNTLVYGSAHSSGGGGGGTAVSSPSDLEVPSQAVIDYIETANTDNSPKNKELYKLSYRTHDRKYNVHNRFGFKDQTAFKFGAPSVLYLKPFYRNADGKYFYASCYISLNVQSGQYIGSDETSVYCLHLEFKSDALDELGNPVVSCETDLYDDDSDGVNGKYVVISPTLRTNAAVVYFEAFGTASDYFNNSGKTDDRSFRFPNDAGDLVRYYHASDGSQVDMNYLWYSFNNRVINESEIDDIGYYVSSEPFTTSYNIITSQIPTNSYFIPSGGSGDSIYNYTIVDGTTGSSDNFGDYITNNYTFNITNNNGGEGGSGTGGALEGAVAVGGHIDVGGSVDVNVGVAVSVPDININVSQSGGAGGAGGGILNPDDFAGDVEHPDFDKYYNQAIEDSSGVRSFLASFFTFLPAEILGLLCFGIVVAIVCRVFGR